MEFKTPISVQQSGTPTDRRTRVRRFFRRVRWGIGIFLLCVLAVFFLVPLWVSNEQGHAYVLGKLNGQCQATVAIGDWSVGWFRGTELRDIRITGKDGTTVLTCGRIKTDLTLWGLLWKNYDVGTGVVDGMRVDITLAPKGHTTLDGLFHAPDGSPNAIYSLLTHLRGSLQTSNGALTVTSASTKEIVALNDIKASVTIASLDSPFHVQVAAAGGTSTVAINATVPALQAWGEGRWPSQLMAMEMDASVTNVPTGVACDLLGTDPQWEGSLGKWLRSIHGVTHVVSAGDDGKPTESTWSLLVQAMDSSPAIDVKARVKSTPHGLRWTIDDGLNGTHALFTMRASPALMGVLAYVNPLLAEWKSSDGTIDAWVATADGPMQGQAEDISATGRIVFPDMMMNRSGLLAPLLNDASAANTDHTGTVAVSVMPTRLKLSDGAIQYDIMQAVVAHRRRISFSGSVALDGRVHLMATIPDALANDGSTLQSATAEVPIGGTVLRPIAGTLATNQ